MTTSSQKSSFVSSHFSRHVVLLAIGFLLGHLSTGWLESALEYEFVHKSSHFDLEYGIHKLSTPTAWELSFVGKMK
jgi:hypothetical protein